MRSTHDHEDRVRYWLTDAEVDRNQKSIIAVATADRPKSVRNSCIIERICSVFVSFYIFIVCRLGVFVIRLLQISSLFLYPPPPPRTAYSIIGSIYGIANAHLSCNLPPNGPLIALLAPFMELITPNPVVTYLLKVRV